MIRLRPLLESEFDEPESIKYLDNVTINLSKKTIEIKLAGGKKNEEGERIFGCTCTQREIFEEVIPLIAKW
jgi:hypothetical protein